MTELVVPPVVMEDAEETREISEGDTFCEEDGEFIGTYECKAGPPIELSVLYKGYWFIYKLDKKEKHEPTNEG